MEAHQPEEAGAGIAAVGYARVALFGVGFQLLLAVAWWITGGVTGASGGVAAGWLALVGSLGWAHAWRVRQLRENPRGQTDEEIDYLLRTALPAMRLFMGVILGYISYVLLFTEEVSRAVAADGALPGLALAASLTVLAGAVTAFFSNLTRTPPYDRLRAGVAWLHANAYLGAALCAGFVALRMGFDVPLERIGQVAALLLAVTGLEILLATVLDFFRPRAPGTEPRPAYESRVLDIVTRAHAVKRSVGEALNYQFGFEVTRSWFLRLVRHSLWPMTLILGGTLWLLSAVVIVEPDEQAVLMRFGRLLSPARGPGLHWKAPWPVDRAVIMQVSGVRRVHVGSHRVGEEASGVYREGVPLLWSNLHGLREDELLILAPPQDLPDLFDGGADREEAADERIRAPSVSLAGGDIHVDYRISDVLAFMQSAQEPEALFHQLAKAETTRELYRYDIDEFLGMGMVEAAPRIAERIRQRADAAQLGIEVLSVGFAGLHPPQAVAADFHETVIARQQRETDIQNAESVAMRLAIEAAGSQRHARDLLEAMRTLDQLAEQDAPSAELQRAQVRLDALLVRSAGRVAERVAEAIAYRWQREHGESGKAEQFARELELRRLLPVFYPRWRYLETVERGMRDARKFVLLADRERMVLRFDFGRIGDMVNWDPAFDEELHAPDVARLRAMDSRADETEDDWR